MRAILDILDFIGALGQGIGALIAIGLIFTGRLTIRGMGKRQRGDETKLRK